MNKPKDTVRTLQGSPSRSLRLHQRDDEDLMLVTASRAAQTSEVASATTRLFLALMRHDDRVRMLVTEVVPQAFPWVRFLPKEDLRRFVVELVDALEGAEALNGSPAPVAHVIEAWRHAAEVHANPELLAILKRESTEDLGPVPEPGTAA